MLFPERPITLNHVRAFCEGHREGLRVEFKTNFNGDVRGKIAKVVSSFANSQGGVLVVGVTADNGVPRPPFEGFEEPEQEELSLTVENICLTGIYPLLLPENVTLVRSDTPGRVFLIVEVGESSKAPHAIENSQKVYVRTGDAANPYDLAKVDLILDLMKRQAEPLALRNKLINDATERASDDRNQNLPRIEVSICPRHPRSAFCDSVDVWNFLQWIQNLQRPMMRVLLPLNGLIRVPDGAANLSQHLTTGTRQYLELNRYGLLHASRPFGMRGWANPADRLLQLMFGDLLHTLVQSATCARSFYQNRFQGEVLVTVSLQSVQNQIMRFFDPAPPFPDDAHPEDFRCHSHSVVVTRVVSVEELRAGLNEFAVGILAELTWAFWQGVGEHPTHHLRAYVARSLA